MPSAGWYSGMISYVEPSYMLNINKTEFNVLEKLIYFSRHKLDESTITVLLFLVTTTSESEFVFVSV